MRPIVPWRHGTALNPEAMDDGRKVTFGCNFLGWTVLLPCLGMFCILFCYWVDHRLLFPSVCRPTERPRRLLSRPQNCRISQSLSTVCVCVLSVCGSATGSGIHFNLFPDDPSSFLPPPSSSSSSGLRPFSFSLSEKDRVALLLLVDSYMRHWTR